MIKTLKSFKNPWFSDLFTAVLAVDSTEAFNVLLGGRMKSTGLFVAGAGIAVMAYSNRIDGWGQLM